MKTTEQIRPRGAEDTPRGAMSLLERRITIGVVLLLCALAAGAWYTTARMSDMTMGLAHVGGHMNDDMAAPLFLGMWVVMMVAMMFPTTAPMVLAHRMVLRKRGEGPLASVAFMAGYLVVWSAAGLVPLAAFVAFRDVSMDAGWVAPLSGAVLVVAGLYQFTPWKRACARACRTPLGFLFTHDFRKGAPGAFRAGLGHGGWCLGCCWALMAVLVVVGLMNLVWMAAIAVIFLAEKTWRHGPALTKVAGAAVAALGVAVLVNPDILMRLA